MRSWCSRCSMPRRGGNQLSRAAAESSADDCRRQPLALVGYGVYRLAEPAADQAEIATLYGIELGYYSRLRLFRLVLLIHRFRWRQRTGARGGRGLDVAGSGERPARRAPRRALAPAC